ncbi:hypothetical protein A2853_00665 [Candidatus Kaiserbacteria bacterium RIFCSPHIGHO2_01_FULL_55_17]|uniref:histidine kinase n=1 Tax=Candidatus Kaiserbacteria bacterium RIFCSPHIGHO2_01_FULL_55_17 TaxID=1798484 RepID=A0A1F6D7W9_9BACT|nr:MAG: hypothetical protein A2853_00665 [Candidatus Kaiserbacteria bacterium RIFCSPHIGHO2_01_FULL_55_17]
MTLGFQADEKLLAQTRKHWIVFFRDAGSAVAIGVTPFVLTAFITLPRALDPENPLFLTALGFVEIIWLLVIWIALVVLWTNYYLDLWVITDQRVMNVEETGLFHRIITAWRFEDIREVVTETRNPVQAFFDYGLVEFHTDQVGERIRMEGVPHPEAISALMSKQMGKYEKLQEVNKKQETLLHTISHEVKAHLTKNEAMFASIVEGDYGTIPEKLKTTANTALAETRQGVSMVMNVLSSSDFKTGTVQFKNELFDVAGAVHRVLAELKPNVERKGLTLQRFIQSGSYIVRGDEQKLREHVIRNLVDNAIHYTPHGLVNVTLTRIDNVIVLAVTDTGIGISSEDLPKLFTEGGKGERSETVNPASTGFGLFIAKSVVEAHGGIMWATSEGADQGSTFYMCLPAAERSPLAGKTVSSRDSSAIHTGV